MSRKHRKILAWSIEAAVVIAFVFGLFGAFPGWLFSILSVFLFTQVVLLAAVLLAVGVAYLRRRHHEPA